MAEERTAAQTCDQPMRGLYGAETICARPAGHTGKHDPIWNDKDWPEASSAACNCGGNHSAIVGFDGPGNGHAVTCPVRTAAQDLELRGVRLRDVYRDKDGDLWEVVSLCDQPIAGFRRVKDGEQVDHVIGCLNMKTQFPKGGVRV